MEWNWGGLWDMSDRILQVSVLNEPRRSRGRSSPGASSIFMEWNWGGFWDMSDRILPSG